MNPLFNLLSNNMGRPSGMNPYMGQPQFNPYQQNQMNGMLDMVKQFSQFKNNFQGDPEQQVKQFLNTGIMSKDQFEQLSQVAKQLQSLLN